jgi:hypothetical protein
MPELPPGDERMGYFIRELSRGAGRLLLTLVPPISYFL